MLKDSQTGRCGVSNGGIGVPGPKDHYSIHPLFLLYHLLDLALDLIQLLALDPTNPHNRALHSLC